MFSGAPADGRGSFPGSRTLLVKLTQPLLQTYISLNVFP